MAHVNDKQVAPDAFGYDILQQSRLRYEHGNGVALLMPKCSVSGGRRFAHVPELLDEAVALARGHRTREERSFRSNSDKPTLISNVAAIATAQKIFAHSGERRNAFKSGTSRVARASARKRCRRIKPKQPRVLSF